MDPRQPWDALHAELAAARAAIDAGDRSRALEHVDAALAIDPNFVAALWLRDHLFAATGHATLSTDNAQAAILEAPSGSSQPALTSTINYGGFEERVRRRRVERRLAAAQAALEHGRLGDARAAIDELIALDPELAELSQLTTRLEELRRRAVAPARRGRWLAAAAFVIAVFGLWDRGERPPTPIRSAVTPASESGTPTLGSGGSVETSVSSAEGPTVRAEPTPADQRAHADADAEPDAARISTSPAPSPLAEPSPQQLAVAPRPLEDRPAIAAVASPAAPAPPPPPPVPPVPIINDVHVVNPVNDEKLVQQALQRYRSAYEGLDAQSAHAVYPAVNEAALARAFDGLVSQSLIFDACDIQLLGGSATATCRGTARYVAKVGKRDPITEPRLWSFTLRKGGDDWTIEKARTER